MTDNINIKDGSGADKTLATKDISSVHHSKHILVDATGAEVNMDTLRDTMGRVQVSVGFTGLGVEMQPISINNRDWSRGISGAREFYSADYALLVSSIQGVKGNNGRIYSESYANDAYQLASYDGTSNSLTVQASAIITLFDIEFWNSHSTDVWIWIWDKGTAPTVGTDSPKYKLRIPVGRYIKKFGDKGLLFVNGCHIAFSTSRDTMNKAPANTITDLFVTRS